MTQVGTSNEAAPAFVDDTAKKTGKGKSLRWPATPASGRLRLRLEGRERVERAIPKGYSPSRRRQCEIGELVLVTLFAFAKALVGKWGLTMTARCLATLIGGAISLVLSAVVAVVPVAQGAAYSKHAIVPIERATFHPPSTANREVCTTISWGFGDFRTECRIDTPGENPALHGICTTYYGRRVCY